MQILTLDRPNLKQAAFLRARQRYVAFGGARGGGKSWAVRVKAALLCLRYAGIRVLIVRRTYPELQENHIRELRALCHEAATYNDQRKELLFGNGSLILFRYCATEGDLERFQGLQADVVFLDEATQFDELTFRKLDACVRGVNPFPKRFYLTCNPGGRGHGWVKRLFVDRRFKPDENGEDYVFIQSLVCDNTALMRSQPDYLRQLEALPPRLRAAWLEGKWDVFEGQFFAELVDRPNPEHIGTHVIPAFDPPRSWKRFRSFDWGYQKPFSCGWWAVSHDGALYRIAELYGCTGEPDEGVRWEAATVFAEIRRIEGEHPYLRGLSVEGVADPALWQVQSGVSIADMAARQGVYFQPGDNKRIPGWMQVRYRLRFDENGRPGLYVFDTCAAFRRTMPLLVYSETRPEDCDTTQEDHVADEVRYLCMRNPVNPPRAVAPSKVYNPLADEPESDSYYYYNL